MNSSARGMWTERLLGGRILTCGALLLLGSSVFHGPVSAWGAEQNKKSGTKQAASEARLTFASLGIPAPSALFLAAGSSMLTIHFVDESHLLVTHAVRELIPRQAGDPVDDEDRIVEGALVEVPSGAVLAKTRWHLHDHGRYLWSLGRGRFLLREGDALSTFVPLQNLKTPDPFFRTPFPYRRGVLDAIVVSADSQLLTIETHVPEKKKPEIDVTITSHSGDPIKPLLYLDFYRLSGDGTEASPFVAAHAGATRSEQAVRLPVGGDGYLVARDANRGRWAVDFQGFGGKSIAVGTVESGCPPGLEMVSSTQWLAFSCRNPMSDSITLMAYDFAQHEIWEEPIGSFLSSPIFAFAPKASRFAISRRLPTSAPGVPLAPNAPSGEAQEVRVYGTQTGDLLLKVNCSPAFLTGENFDLSPDGMRLAYVRDEAIEIVHLPELTKTDREDLAELAKLMPPPGTGPVSLQRLAAGADQKASSGAVTAAVSTQVAVPVNAAESIDNSEAVASAGDETAHKRPTLLKPGERPEFRDKGSGTQ